MAFWRICCRAGTATSKEGYKCAEKMVCSKLHRRKFCQLLASAFFYTPLVMELERHEGLNERNKPALENYATIIYVTLIGSNPILLPIPWAAMPVRVRIPPGGLFINHKCLGSSGSRARD